MKNKASIPMTPVLSACKSRKQTRHGTVHAVSLSNLCFSVFSERLLGSGSLSHFALSHIILPWAGGLSTRYNAEFHDIVGFTSNRFILAVRYPHSNLGGHTHSNTEHMKSREPILQSPRGLHVAAATHEDAERCDPTLRHEVLAFAQ